MQKTQPQARQGFSPAESDSHHMSNFQNVIPRIVKIIFFMKFKTSSTLPPYYSIEPMKYALRVIFYSQECFLMIPEAPQPQIWTQSRNLKNHHFYHFCDLYVRILAVDEMVFYASPGALLLHVLIKMLEVSAKTSRGPERRLKI